MAKFIREGYVTTELSEEFAGYWAHLIHTWNDGREEEVDTIPFKEKWEAQDCVEKFISDDSDKEG